MTFGRCISIVPFTLPLLLASGAGRADTYVTACESDIQTVGVNLAQALAVGGTIWITCPAGSRIQVTKRYTVPPNTLIHGNGTAVLDGGGIRGVFLDVTGGKLTLRRITLRNFAVHRWRSNPSARFWNSVALVRGDLELDQVTIEGSESPIEARGTIVVTNSSFRNNSGAVITQGRGGTLLVTGSTFSDNHRAISFSSGRIQRSTFAGHAAGAISIVYPIRQAEVRDCEFRGTRGTAAIALSQRAGREGASPVRLRANRFHDNAAGGVRIYDAVATAPEVVRGALMSLPGAAFDLAYNRFSGNRASGAGGAIDADLRHTGGLRVEAGLFVNNSAASGGAISVSGGPVTVTHSIFKENRANEGAALFAGSGATVTLGNSLIVANSGPGAAVAVGGGRIVNATIADNDGFGLSSVSADGALSVRNSIMSGNRAGNCRGLTAAALEQPNVQFGAADCPGVPVVDPYLDRFYVPTLGSPAFRLGDAAACREDPVGGTDVVFQLRSKTDVCALGAYEQPPLRVVPRLRERLFANAQVGERVPDALAEVTPAGGAEPGTSAHHVLITAAEAEERAPSRRARLTSERDGSTQTYVIERSGRDRVRLIARTEAGGFESVAVRGVVYWRSGAGGWTRAPDMRAAADTSLVSIVALFRHGLRDARDVGTRSGAGSPERIVAGNISWGNGRARNEGKLVMAVQTTTGLPTEVLFRGSCGGTRCAFHQTFEYVPLTIELPDSL